MNKHWLALLVLPLLLCAADIELKHDKKKKAGQQSFGHTGHVIEFEAPKGTLWIKSVLIHGSRYGRADEDATFHVYICDENLKELTGTEASYDLFKTGRFEWTEVTLNEPIKAPQKFKVCVHFRATASGGVYMGWTETKQTHSTTGHPGFRESPYGEDKEWMIRVTLSKKKPKISKAAAKKSKKADKNPSTSKAAVYREDFDFLEKTIKRSFPAFKKKGVDWRKVCKEWEPKFKACQDDETHLKNVARLLAVLNDAHTGITNSKIKVHYPAFDNLFGGGLWIAADRGRLLLRAMMDGHELKKKVQPGAELVRIGGRPARVVHHEVCQKILKWSGFSSQHFLDARLSYQFFLFEKDILPLEFLNPDGSLKKVNLPKRGPGGRGLSRQRATMPEDVEAKGSAVSARLSNNVGYLRILGGMNVTTQEAFFDAFDELKDVEGIILDCRGMGGGGDSSAWSMAGRFMTERTNNGTNGFIEPSGSWQFDGPVVMLQDEREISSAETFTWAMTETGRAVSVGRPTGGGTIIPTVFEAPSKLFSFRLGRSDRFTPIKRIQPEGIGSPPDVFVPYEPALLKRYSDPILVAAKDIVLLLMDGAPRAVVTDYYGGLLGTDPKRLKKSLTAFQKLELPKKSAGFSNMTDDLIESMVEWEIKLCSSKHYPMPDFIAADKRLEALAEIAGLLGLENAAEAATVAADSWKAEIVAQKEYEKLLKKRYPPDEKSLNKYIGKHESTRFGKGVKSAFK